MTVWKNQRSSDDQDCSPGHLTQPPNITVSNSKGLHVLVRATHDRGQLPSGTLYQQHNCKSPLLWISKQFGQVHNNFEDLFCTNFSI